jgi:signal transduction histidine kinase
MANLAILIPLSAWLVGSCLMASQSTQGAAAWTRSGLFGLWTGLAVIAVIAAPAMGGRTKPLSSLVAVLVFVALILPFLAAAWLTATVSTEALTRGIAGLAAWTAVAVVVMRAAAQLPPPLTAISITAVQVGMLALLAASWHSWLGWIGP